MANTFEQTTADISGHPWEFYGAVARPLYVSIYQSMYTLGHNQRYGSPLSVLIAFEDNRCHWLMRGDQLQSLAESFLPTFLTKQWGYYNQWVDELDRFDVFNRNFLKMDLAALDDVGLRSLMGRYCKAFEVPFVTNNIIEPLSFYFLHHLKRLLQEEGVDEARTTHLMDVYGQAVHYSYTKECAEEYRHTKSDAEVSAILTKYYYLNNDYGGAHPLAKGDLDQLAKMSEHVVAPVQTTKGLSPRAQALLGVMQIIATIQDVRKKTFLEMVSAAGAFGKEFAKRTGIPYEDIEFATWAELESGAPDPKELARRRSLCVMHWTLEGDTIFSGEEAKALVQEINTHVLKTDAGAKEVKGFCASKGKVTGRAVIVLHPGEFDRVQAGDILITMMTRPEFLPVMHRAAAFICDEGGITSHAAIVAREMKKPCVVGTRNGTRVFKDGDVVEVDAERGIVRILR